MQWDFGHMTLIPKYNYILTLFGCYRKEKYKSKLKKAKRAVAKELDLIKFI